MTTFQIACIASRLDVSPKTAKKEGFWLKNLSEHVQNCEKFVRSCQ